MVRESVGAFRCADDEPSRPDDRCRRRHALHRLIEILIEWIAGVGRHDDIELLGNRAHRHLPDSRPRGGMHGENLAAECRDDALIAVEHYVEGEVDAGSDRNRAHVVVYWVTLADSPGGEFAADARGVMQG